MVNIAHDKKSPFLSLKAMDVVAVVLTVMILKWTVTVVIVSNSMFSPLAIWVSSPETATKKKTKTG